MSTPTLPDARSTGAGDPPEPRPPRRWWVLALVLAVIAAGIGVVATRDTTEPAAQIDDEPADEPADSVIETGPEAPVTVERIRLDAEGGFGFISPFSYRSGGRGMVRMQLMFDTLTWQNAQGEQVPVVAESWTVSDDGTEWRFRLRENATWHDGTPLTADDVVFTFQYYQEGAGDKGRNRPAFPVEAVAEGPHEVVLRVDEPAATFEREVLNRVPILPQHVWADVEDPAEFRAPEAHIGSGPYMLQDADPATGAYLFVANEDYYLGPPPVRRVEFVPASNPLLALRQGELDMAYFGIGDDSVPDEALTPFEDDRYGTVNVPGLWNRTIFFNPTQGFPYDDARFRQALAHAVDRSDLVDRILLGRGEVGSMGGLTPGSFWVAPDLPTYDHDPVKAGGLLDEIGMVDVDGDGFRDLPDGSAFTPEMISNARFNAKTAELVQEYLREVGINLQVVTLDSGSADAAGAEGNYAIALVGHGFGDAGPDELRTRYAGHSTQRDFMRVYGNDNERFNELATEQLVTLDVDRRMEMAQEMQRLFAEDVRTISLYVPDRYMIYDQEVFDGWFFWDFDLQVQYKQILVEGVGSQ